MQDLHDSTPPPRLTRGRDRSVFTTELRVYTCSMGCTSTVGTIYGYDPPYRRGPPKGCKGHLGMCSFVADKPTPTSLSPSVCLSVCLPACLSFFLSPGLWAGIPQPAHCPRPRLSLSLSLLLACLLACLLGVLGANPPARRPTPSRSALVLSSLFLFWNPKKASRWQAWNFKLGPQLNYASPRPQICVGSQAGNQKENSR